MGVDADIVVVVDDGGSTEGERTDARMFEVDNAEEGPG